MAASWEFLRFLVASFNRWRRGVTPWRLLFLGLILFVLVVSSLVPYMRNPGRSWWRLSDWGGSIREGAWIVIACTFVLRYEKDFLRFLFQRGDSHEYQVRMADLARLVDQSRTLDLRKTNDVERFRAEVLRCVTSGIAERLGLDEKSLTANLLALTSQPPSTMSVVARSNNLRKTNAQYPTVDGFLPWRAICSGAIEIEHDYKEREGYGPRPYRSIVTIPVTKGEVAYGCLSIDCKTPYAFYGQRRHIYSQCRPYIALLSLTFGPASPYHECRFNPAHLG